MSALDRPSQKTSAGRRPKAALLAVAAFAFAAASTPAFAGGGYSGGYYGGYSGHYAGHGGYGYGGYGRGYYGRGYSGSYYSGRGHHRGHGGLSGGEAALIALGVVGGAILIDRALDDRRYEDRRYDDRNYRDRRYENRRGSRRDGAFDDDYYYQRDSRPYEDDDDGRVARSADYPRDGVFDAGEPELLGGSRAVGSAGRVAVNAAFRECVAETRGAAGAGGLTVAMPGAPTEVQELADGSVRMVAQFRASNGRGQDWTRRFVCEADERGVRFLQVD